MSLLSIFSSITSLFSIVTTLGGTATSVLSALPSGDTSFAAISLYSHKQCRTRSNLWIGSRFGSSLQCFRLFAHNSVECDHCCHEFSRWTNKQHYHYSRFHNCESFTIFVTVGEKFGHFSELRSKFFITAKLCRSYRTRERSFNLHYLYSQNSSGHFCE